MVGNGKLGEGAKVPSHVAVVALGPSSLRYIQQCNMVGSRSGIYDEVWTVNTYVDVIASDRLFHMDDFRIQELRAAAGNTRVANMLEAIKRYPGPVYTCFPQERYPTSVAFPLVELVRRFKTLYLNNTVPFMVAFAGLIGVKKLTIFGADYTYPDKELAEAGRSCTEYWLGILHANSVEINVCDQSTLMDGRLHTNNRFPLYGYSDLHEIWMEQQTDSSLQLKMKAREVSPTAEEIEKKYYHGPGEGTQSEINVLDTPVV